jgi:hypothetical protein
VPEGQPFLISPVGVYDVALNQYCSVWLASSPWSTQAAHARDLRTYFDFLWFARGRRDWRDTSMGDRAAYEWWRCRDERVPRLEDELGQGDFHGQPVLPVGDRAGPCPGQSHTPARGCGVVTVAGRGGAGGTMVRQVPAETSQSPYE